VPLVRGCLLDVEAVPLQEELKSLAALAFIVEGEQLKEVAVSEVLQQLAPRRGGGCSGNSARFFRFYRLQVNTLFEDLPSVYLFFNAVASDQSVHDDVPLLANPAHSVDGLVVVRRVPIGVEDDNPIRPSKVQTESADLRCEEAAEVRLIIVELLADGLPRSDLGVSVDPQVLEFGAVLIAFEYFLDQVEHLLAHRKYEHAVALPPQVLHKGEQEPALGGVLDHGLVLLPVVLVLDVQDDRVQAEGLVQLLHLFLVHLDDPQLPRLPRLFLLLDLPLLGLVHLLESLGHDVHVVLLVVLLLLLVSFLALVQLTQRLEFLLALVDVAAVPLGGPLLVLLGSVLDGLQLPARFLCRYLHGFAGADAVLDLLLVLFQLLALKAVQHLLLLRNKQPYLLPFLSASRGQKVWMLAEFLDIAEDEESVLEFSVLYQLLQTLVLDNELVNFLLDF